MLALEDIKRVLLGSEDLGLVESDLDIDYIESLGKGDIGYYVLKVCIARGGREYQFKWETSLDSWKNRLREVEREMIEALGIGEQEETRFSAECTFNNSSGEECIAHPFHIDNLGSLRTWIREVIKSDGEFDGFLYKHQYGTISKWIPVTGIYETIPEIQPMSPVGKLFYMDVKYEMKPEAEGKNLSEN